jgi:asparagine N-glycosylation enzyme membrane subunit Stt3
MKFLKELIIKKDWRLKQIFIVLLAVFCLGTSLRIGASFLKDRITKDGVLYVYMAEDVMNVNNEHPPFSRNRRIPPLYTYLMALVSSLTGCSVEAAGYAVSIAAGALLVFPVFMTASLLFSVRAGAVAAFLIAVNPYLIRISSTIMRDSLFSFLLFCSIFFLVKALNSPRKPMFYWFAAGVFLSLSIACRNEAIELLGVLFVYPSAEYIFIRRRNPSLFPAGYYINMIIGIAVMFTAVYITYLPLAASLQGTESDWSLIDRRIPGYFRTLLKISEKDALKSEDSI